MNVPGTCSDAPFLVNQKLPKALPSESEPDIAVLGTGLVNRRKK